VSIFTSHFIQLLLGEKAQDTLLVGGCLILEVVWARNGKNNNPAAVGNRTPVFHPTCSKSELRLTSWWSPFLGISDGVDRISLFTWKGTVFQFL